MHQRILFVAFGLIALFSGLIVKFFHIQVLDHKKWVAKANLQHQTVVTDNFKRGVFYSNTSVKVGHEEKPKPLAYDVLKYHLFVDPISIPAEHHEPICDMLATFTHVDKSELMTQFGKKSRSRKLVKWLSSDQKITLENWFKGYARRTKLASNGLFFVRDYKRVYPFGKLLGQVLHTVREERNEVTSQAIPTGGLEVYFDQILRGKKGKKLILRSPRQQLETMEILEPVQNGLDVYLTINHYLQAICEQELEKGVRKVKGAGGTAIIMDPHSGEIYAMAQYPFFNPEEYKTFYNDPEKISSTSIKNISDCYEPGSTMKAITVAIALMANRELEQRGEPPLFDPLAKMPTSDPTFPGRGPLKDVAFHKYLNMFMAIQRSSNIYVARLVQKIIKVLGAEWYREALSSVFGFGKNSGVELPYENGGFLPQMGKTYGRNKLQWSTPTPFSLAMGYNLMVNNVQMASAFSVIANGGYRVSPTLVKRVEGGGVRLNHAPMEKVIDTEICEMVRDAMKFVTKKGGAGVLGDVDGFSVAAKTSTTEKLIDGKYDKNRHVSTFIGFVPANSPRFVLSVVVDDPEKRFIPGFGTTHFGGKCAAPIFREIAKKSLAYLGVKPDDPYGFGKNDPRSDLEKADWVYESEQLAKLYDEWNNEN